jgi:hypothetical protein
VEREELLEDGREHVLSGVLLHVIEAPVPIDRARDFVGRRDRRREAMRDPSVVGIGDFEDRDAVDVAEVEGLAAGGRIEGGAVEVEGQGVGRAVGDAGGELTQVGVGVIEAVRHG